MLKKLLKQEFLATARVMGILYLVMLVLAMGSQILVSRLGDLGDLVRALCLVAAMACGLLTLPIMIVRFRQNLLGDEGYLMFTLPVSVHQHVWSKLIVSAVWFILTGVVVVLSVLVLAFNVSFLTDLAEVFPKLFEQLNAYYAFNGTAFILEGLILLFAGCMTFSLQFYAALAVGHSFPNHKMALSVVFYFVFQFAMQILGAFLILALDEGPLYHLLMRLDFHIDGAAAVHFAMWILIVLTALYGAVFYFVTALTLKKRLNLE